MKNITLIWQNPKGWSSRLAGNKAKVIMAITCHMIITLIGLLLIEKFNVQSGLMPILLAGVFLPSLYIYAIYRMVISHHD